MNCLDVREEVVHERRCRKKYVEMQMTWFLVGVTQSTLFDLPNRFNRAQTYAQPKSARLGLNCLESDLVAAQTSQDQSHPLDRIKKLTPNGILRSTEEGSEIRVNYFKNRGSAREPAPSFSTWCTV